MVASTVHSAPIDLQEAAAAPSVESSQPAYLHGAIRAIRRGDQQGALQTIRQAQKAQADMAPAELVLANLIIAEGREEQGRQILEQAAVLYPADPEPHLLFGDLAWRQRRITDACVQYQRGLDLTSNFDGSPPRKRRLEIWALAGLGSVAEVRGQLDTARDLFNKLLDLEANHPQARFRLGHVLFGLGEIDAAVQQFRAAGKLHESTPSAELTIASLYQQGGDSQQAQRWIREAIDASPESAVPLIAMTRFLLEVRHDPVQAAEFANRAAQVAPEASEPKLLRGLVAWHLGELRQAERLFERLALESPDEATVNNYLAAVLAEQDDPARKSRALELAQLTASAHPQNAESAAALGWVEFQLGQLAEAEQHLRASVSLPQSGRDAEYYLARVLFRRGQIVAAQQLVRKALSAEGPFIHLREARSWQEEIDGSPAEP